jgi:putative resolvase
MDGYLNSKEARESLRVTSATLRRWDKEGKINTVRTPSGLRLYSKDSIQQILNVKGVTKKRRKIAYCRVSSKKQVDDLERQKEFLRLNFPDHELVQDVGSGINFKRKGLQGILESAMLGEVEELVVSHKDRLCRFAYELIEWILNKNGARILLLDNAEHKSSSEELANDVLTIIQVFACREMGKRRYKNSENQTKPESETETDNE